MKPITQEWGNKAEGDWTSAGREGIVQTDPNYDLVCFLAQQCAEKYLKAALQEESITPPKTHDLEKLMDLLLPTQPFWKALLPALDQLSNYAVSFRYPGQDADNKEAQDALEYCRKVREVARRSFGLPV